MGGGTVPRSEDSASIKSYDNRAQLIPLPIINARIKLDLSDESTERGHDRSHHSDYDMNYLSVKNEERKLIIVLNLERQAPYVIGADRRHDSVCEPEIKLFMNANVSSICLLDGALIY